MSDTWINHGIYPLLENIGNFSVYFAKVCTYLAAICFLMTLLMAAIKIFLGITDAREQIIKMGVSLCMYFIMMFLYPITMKAILPFAMNLGYGAIFGTSNAETFNGSYDELSGHGGSRASFYKWMGEHTGDIFTSSTDENAKANEVSVALNMNMIDANTGYIDLNKFLLFIVAFLKVGFHALPKVSILNMDMNLILSCFLYFLAVIVAVACMFVVIVNYVMCLIDYFALMGFGILTIPLSLWDGTKSYTEKLYGSIGSIVIKLLVISTFMCFCCMEMINFFIEVYLSFLDVGLVFTLKDTFKLVELSVTLVLKGFLIAVLTMQTEKIANFINGQSPSMSFKEAVQGGIQTAFMAGGAGKLAGSTASGIRGLQSGASRARGAGITSKFMGGSGKDAISSMAATAGHSIGRSAVNGIANAPKNFKGALNSFAGMTGVKSGGDSDFIGGLGFMKGIGEGGSSGGGGGSSGGGGRGGSSGGGNGSSGLPNDRSEGFVTDNVQGHDNLQKDNSGLDSVYGFSEKNNDGTYTSTADKMTGMAGSLSTGNYFERKAGAILGTAGAVMKEMRTSRAERDAGNRIGNERGTAIARGLKKGMRGYAAGEMNAGGGMQIRFNHSSDMKNLYGSSVTARVNSNDSMGMNKEGQFVKNPVDLIKN